MNTSEPTPDPPMNRRVVTVPPGDKMNAPTDAEPVAIRTPFEDAPNMLAPFATETTPVPSSPTVMSA